MRQNTFAGFQAPNFTKVPNDVFDWMLKDLTGAELRVLLYIIRRTFGWHQHAERITQADIAEATGLTRRAVRAAAVSLVNRRYIAVESGQANGEGNLYRLEVSPEGGGGMPVPPPPGGVGTVLPTQVGTVVPTPTSSKERSTKEKRSISSDEEEKTSKSSPVSRLLDRYYEIPNITRSTRDGGVVASLVKKYGEGHVMTVLDEHSPALAAHPEIAMAMLVKRCQYDNGDPKKAARIARALAASAAHPDVGDLP